MVIYADYFAFRLDRLFLLLDTGSTPHVRKSAAEQLGQVQKLYPHELCSLLEKVCTFQGRKLQNNSAFPSEKCRKDLPVRHYFCLSTTNRQRVISLISAIPLEKCLKFILVRLQFYLSRTGGQCVISIPAFVVNTRFPLTDNRETDFHMEFCVIMRKIKIIFHQLFL